MPLLTAPQMLTSEVGPAYENDNCVMKQSNGLVSVSFAQIGESWVVSAFRVGADGKPDTDNGEIFVREIARETEARWFYRSCVATLSSHKAQP
jgi:hypothetical protein